MKLAGLFALVLVSQGFPQSFADAQEVKEKVLGQPVVVKITTTIDYEKCFASVHTDEAGTSCYVHNDLANPESLIKLGDSNYTNGKGYQAEINGRVVGVYLQGNIYGYQLQLKIGDKNSRGPVAPTSENFRPFISALQKVYRSYSSEALRTVGSI